MSIKRVVLWLVLILTLGMTGSFAGEKTYDGWRNLILVNGQSYQFGKGDYLRTYDEGTYFSPKAYKRMLNLDVVKEGTDWVVSQKGNVIVKINETEAIEYKGERLQLVQESEDGDWFIMFEPILAKLMPKVEMTNEILFDYPSEMPDLKIIRLNVSPEYFNAEAVEEINPYLLNKSFATMKKTQAVIGKMESNKPVIKAGEMIYQDKSCRVIFSKDANELLNITFTGKLSPDAKTLMRAVLSDDIDPKMVEMAMKKIISLNAVILDLKKYDSAFGLLVDNDTPLWIYLSDPNWMYCKYNCYGSMVQGKPYIDITFADVFWDVSDVN